MATFQRSILCEVDENGFLGRVVMCVDLFNEVDGEQLEKTPGRAPNVVHFDGNSAMTWATYVVGYIDGCHSSRTAAPAGNAHQR